MVKCARCERDAVVKLSYNKADLCSRCFCNMFENRVKHANKKFKLIGLNQKIAVGISGGKDSAAMLYVLSELVKNIHGTALIPIAVDEGIEGYRSQSIDKARELCQMLGLELQVFRYKDYFDKSMDEVIQIRDEKSENQRGFEARRSCTYCGVMRKWLLNRAAREVGANSLAIGHNADDTAQTFLMNMLRSEPDRFERFEVKGGEKDGFVKRIKPMIFNLEKECAIYCELKGIPYYRGECPYSAEAFRGEAKDFLNETEAKYPGVKFNLLKSYLNLREKMDRLEELEGKETVEEEGSAKQTSNPIAKCQVCGENTSEEVCKACQFMRELA